MKIVLSNTEIKNIVGNFYQITNFDLEIVPDENEPTKVNDDKMQKSFERMILCSGIAKGSTIPLIKAIRAVTNFSLCDSKEIKDQFACHLSHPNRYDLFNRILTFKGINLVRFYEDMDKYAW